MSFTTLEQEAVDFYETHASYVSAFGLLNALKALDTDRFAGNR